VNDVTRNNEKVAADAYHVSCLDAKSRLDRSNQVKPIPQPAMNRPLRLLPSHGHFSSLALWKCCHAGVWQGKIK
jgi:hypothetical protein